MACLGPSWCRCSKRVHECTHVVGKEGWEGVKL